MCIGHGIRDAIMSPDFRHGIFLAKTTTDKSLF